MTSVLTIPSWGLSTIAVAGRLRSVLVACGLRIIKMRAWRSYSIVLLFFRLFRLTKKLIEQGTLPRNESIVICITGNGLKTQEPLANKLGSATQIKPTLASFEKELAQTLAAAKTK